MCPVAKGIVHIAPVHFGGKLRDLGYGIVGEGRPEDSPR